MIWARFRFAGLSLDAFHHSDEQAFNALNATWQEFALANGLDRFFITRHADKVSYQRIEAASCLLAAAEAVTWVRKKQEER